MKFIMIFLGWYDIISTNYLTITYFLLWFSSRFFLGWYNFLLNRNHGNPWLSLWFGDSLSVKLCSDATLHVWHIGPCWRVSQAICKDQDILLHCCGLMGCRLLCQGGWRCSPKPRYYSLYAPLNPPTILDRFLIYLWRCAGMLVATLGRHKLKPRVYIGCMKSGPVLSDK